MTESPSSFDPLQRATSTRLRVLWLLGPVLWLVALVVVVIFVRRTDVLRWALLAVVLSLLLAFAVLITMRRARVREEQRAR